MAGFFYNLGRMVGPKVRKAEWVYRSLTGTEAEAIQAERAVGRDLAQAFLEQLEADPEPAARQHLDYLAAKLTAGLRAHHWPLRVLAVRAPEVNAFALPGGYVFVTRRLIDFCAWDHAELAFVLGHEMGHVVKRHAIERLMANTLFSGVLARLPLGGSVLRPHVAALLTTLLHQGYSREQELEADAFGARLAAAAGFDPAAGRRMLVRLGAESAAAPLLSGYFASHPPLDVRLRNLDTVTAR
jgi:predicted Zn-dependent protease